MEAEAVEAWSWMRASGEDDEALHQANLRAGPHQARSTCPLRYDYEGYATANPFMLFSSVRGGRACRSHQPACCTARRQFAFSRPLISLRSGPNDARWHREPGVTLDHSENVTR
jgi:hypothetical protein